LVSASLPKRRRVDKEEVDELDDDESIIYERWRYSDEKNEYLDEGVTQYQYDHLQLAHQEGRPAPGAEWTNAFPDTFRVGAEMDVKIVKVQDDYALCRPVDHPHLKGLLTTREMDEDAVWKAYQAVQVDTIYKASVLKLILPHRVLFSLRRVRRLLRDDFQPFTVALFNVPYDVSEQQIQQVLEQGNNGGKVLYVNFTTTSVYESSDGLTIREPVMVTFLHEADARAAMTKWNRTKMPFVMGYDDDDIDENGQKVPFILSHRLRLKKAHRQSYREETQEYLDDRLAVKTKRWDETARDRYDRHLYDEEVAAILPYHVMDLQMEQLHYLWGHTDTLPDYTVKNCPRPASSSSSSSAPQQQAEQLDPEGGQNRNHSGSSSSSSSSSRPGIAYRAQPPSRDETTNVNNTTTSSNNNNRTNNNHNGSSSSSSSASSSSSSEPSKPIQYFKY
jgi:hypothetical protein